jgi:hypothetical protein
MPVSRVAPPESSQTRLTTALAAFSKIRADLTRWMNFSPATSGRERRLHPHAVYSVRLIRFLQGKPLSATLKRVGWMYFLRDSGSGLMCGEVSIVSGRHKNARLSQGPFVKAAFQSIEKSIRDPRIGRRHYELRSLRLESIHLYCLWLKVDEGAEYFVPVTSNGAVLKKGIWISRREFTNALRLEGERVQAAREHMLRLLKARQA